MKCITDRYFILELDTATGVQCTKAERESCLPEGKRGRISGMMSNANTIKKVFLGQYYRGGMFLGYFVSNDNEWKK